MFPFRAVAQKIKVHFSEPGPGSTRKPSTFTFRGKKTLKLMCTKICALRLAAEVIIEHHYYPWKPILVRNKVYRIDDISTVRIMRVSDVGRIWTNQSAD